MLVLDSISGLIKGGLLVGRILFWHVKSVFKVKTQNYLIYYLLHIPIYGNNIAEVTNSLLLHTEQTHE